ncbi:MAG: hypothetical protein EHM70_20285 [Chloroflexota bacterium]|nr:MAG: hypothetical protein EHM70_20285 [Chloroflexota bacterium]
MSRSMTFFLVGIAPLMAFGLACLGLAYVIGGRSTCGSGKASRRPVRKSAATGPSGWCSSAL